MNVKQISLNSISLGDNSRDTERTKDVSELMQSIKSNGLLQPVCVKKKGKRFELVYGNRRLIAHKKLMRKTIPAIVLDTLSAEDRIKTIITENLQREDVSAFEQGRLFYQLQQKFNMSINELSNSLGVPKTTVREFIDAYQYLPKEFRDKVKLKTQQRKGSKTDAISLSTARAVVTAKKNNKINAKQTKDILTQVKKNSLNREQARRVCGLVSQGVTISKAVTDAEKLKNVSVPVQLTKSDHERLVKEYGSEKALVNHFASTVYKCRTYKIKRP